MDIKYLILIANVIFCLVSSLAISAHVRNHNANQRPACLMSCICFAFFATIIATVYFLPRFYDFTTNVHTRYFILPATAFMLLAAISLIVKHRLFFPLAALLLTVTVVFCLPDFHITFAAVLPLWLNRILTVFLWLAAAFSLRLFNANDGLVAIETLGISFGIFILSLIGSLPFLVGCFSLDAAAVSFALLLYGAYPAQISLDRRSCDLFGLLLGWLIIFAAAEGAGAAVIIFCLPLICETLWSLAKRLTFLAAYADVYANPVYCQAAAGGLHPKIINTFFGRINVVLLLFGGFQVFAPNGYSLPMLCVVITIWNLYRLQHWQEQPRNLRDINRRFVSDIKDGVRNIKDSLRKD